MEWVGVGRSVWLGERLQRALEWGRCSKSKKLAATGMLDNRLQGGGLFEHRPHHSVPPLSLAGREATGGFLLFEHRPHLTVPFEHRPHLTTGERSGDGVQKVRNSLRRVCRTTGFSGFLAFWR